MWTDYVKQKHPVPGWYSPFCKFWETLGHDGLALTEFNCFCVAQKWKRSMTYLVIVQIVQSEYTHGFYSTWLCWLAGFLPGHHLLCRSLQRLDRALTMPRTNPQGAAKDKTWIVSPQTAAQIQWCEWVSTSCSLKLKSAQLQTCASMSPGGQLCCGTGSLQHETEQEYPQNLPQQSASSMDTAKQQPSARVYFSPKPVVQALQSETALPARPTFSEK